MAKPPLSNDSSRAAGAERAPQDGPPPERPPEKPPESSPPPAEKPPHSSAPPAETPRPTPDEGNGEGPCCCQLVLWLEEVRVETLTDAGSIPGVADLLGFLSSDHVFVGARDMATGRTVTYPDDPNGIKLDEGETAGDMLLFEIPSDPREDCAVRREIKVYLNKGSRLNKLLDIIDALSAEIARILAEIARDTDAMRGLLALVPPDMAAVARLAAKIAANDQNLAGLQKRLSELLKLLAGTDDTLMDQFSVLVAGALPCGKEDWTGVLKEPRGWTLDPADKDRAFLNRKISRLGGVWHIRLVMRRICPPGRG